MAVIIAGSFAVASLASAEVNSNKIYNLRLYGLAEQFEWKESINDREVVKESGPLFGVGGELGLRVVNPLWIEGRGELFLGEVDYNGAIQTSAGHLIPYKSTTKYVGAKVDSDIAFKLPIARNFYLKPYAGLGVRAWQRTLDSNFSDTDPGRYGYVENWLTTYGIIGCGGGIAVCKNGELFGRIEGRLPIYNSITADFTNQDGPSDVKIEPGKRPSVYAETGINVTPITVSIFVETLAFSESPLDNKYQTVIQPDSKATMLGVKLGLVF